MSVSDEDAQARAEFEEMVRTAARDNRVTGLKYSLQQARSGAYALFGAGLVFLAFGLACFFSATLAAFDSLRIEHARIAAAIVYFVATGTMFVLFFWARRDRLWPSVAGLALYGCLLAPTAVMMSNAFWFLEFLVLLSLIDGVRARFQHRRILRRALQCDERAESQTSGV